MESLRRQVDAPFWELILWDDGEDCFDVLKTFVGKLPQCQRIVYRAIDSSWHRKDGALQGIFPLIDKWIGMAFDSSPQSKAYVLQASDCYSSPKRLWLHGQHFEKKECLFSTQRKGCFYNLLTREKMLYQSQKNSNHLNMALKTCDMRKITPIDRNKRIDSYLLACARKRNPKGRIFFFEELDGQEWQYSLDTDGANRISMGRRKRYQDIQAPFEQFSGELKLPKVVVQFLKNYPQPKHSTNENLSDKRESTEEKGQ